MNLSDIIFILVVLVILITCLAVKKRNNKHDNKEAPIKCRGCSNFSFCKGGKKGEEGDL